MSKQIIYQTLLQSGMTQAAALGMMGNMQCESGLEPNRVQGDFSSFRTVSKSYVARATNGSMSKSEFISPVGFGLCQWTFGARKAALWDFWKQSGKALDDPAMQTEFAVAELKKDYRRVWDDEAKEYVDLWKELTESNQIYTCTKDICRFYERPAHNNIGQRFTAAVSLKAELANVQPEPTPEPTKEVYFPPRTIQKGMSGDDVLMLQAILKCRGYDCERVDGIFDERTKNRVLAFQSEHTDANNMPLDTDGIVGRLTWGAIMSLK